MRDEGVLGDVVVVVPVGEAVVQAGLIDEIGEQENRAEPEKPLLTGGGTRGSARGLRSLGVRLPGSWFRHGVRARWRPEPFSLEECTGRSIETGGIAADGLDCGKPDRRRPDGRIPAASLAMVRAFRSGSCSRIVGHAGA